MDIAKVYQSTCPVSGVIISKVKGFASTEYLTDTELNVTHPELYRRTWDPADIIYPAQGGEGGTGSFTIITNLIMTSKQMLGTCAENLDSPCTSNSDCLRQQWSAKSHGVFTGRCLNETGTCEISGWCPIENSRLPRNGKKPLLEDVEHFTVMLKNTVEFPDCGNQHGRNIRDHTPVDYLGNCTYHKLFDPFCPIFKIGDIVKWSGVDYASVSIRGGVFRIQVSWECDFDFGKTVEDCRPTYHFSHVDDRVDGVSNGLRHAEYFADNTRTLMKQYGFRILISLEGEGRKFDFFQLIRTLGATIGLFALAPLVCDFLLDLFNTISGTKLCGKCCKPFHDNTLSRYYENPDSDKCKELGKGLDNLGICASAASLNSGTFKHVPD